MLPLLAQLLISGAAGIGGALSNRSKTYNGTSTSTSSSTGTPEAEALNGALLKMIQSRMTSSADLSGYQNQGIQNINKTFGDARLGLDADLMGRGLSTSPAALNPLSRFEAGRGQAISSFTNSLPLLQRDLQGQDMDLASRYYAMQPRTTTTTGTGTQQYPGNAAGAGATDFATMLAFLMGSGAFRKQSSGMTMNRQAYPDLGGLFRPQSPALR